ncbi:MAG TPA: DinB family protein [Acidobacteriaceae bacterium]|jgi:uncharacterized damage-inducible protein DinB|nr:DinB family protein [Acidobacteriaceae bacterium]
MRVSNWWVIGLLTIAVASASGQARDYKDTYTSSEAGKPMAPAKALDVMLTQLETQVLAAAQAMPAEKYGFAPTAETFAPGSPAKYGTVRTFAGELTHIAGANYNFYSKVSGAAPPAAAKQVRDLKTKDEILAALKQSFAYGHAQIMTITPQNAFIGIQGADGFHTPATVAAFAVAHGYDHYGQIVEYLRMNGVVPPGSN